ncbi:MAG: penicillin-binding transpeptidase domain-containing protein, partial [Prolixibacteraceae bacterium]|nr:penicillin-binding transpeptidase domain-containing protein [Prolixibacteraceae bacterium]
PVIYLAALENGANPLDYFSNEKKTYPEYQDWSPSNSDGKYEGYYSMKGALTKSINTISAELIMQTGINKTIETARKLGIKSDLPEYPSLALGAASLSLREMLTTYSAILNGGIPIEPHILVRIENNEGNILEEFEEPYFEESGIDPENCRLIVDMLSNVIEDGTGRAIRSTYKIHGDFAGKTGTTQNHADGWFIGLTPSLIAGCWVGADDPAVHFRTLTYGQGAYMALPIVGKFYNKMYADPKFAYMQIQQFEKPEPDMLLAINNLEPWVESIRPSYTFTEIPTLKDEITSQGQEKLQQRQNAEKEDKEPVWTLIKNIFKKKEK